jgi:hypothetical protein
VCYGGSGVLLEARRGASWWSTAALASMSVVRRGRGDISDS